jgi:hypothetical protein
MLVRGTTDATVATNIFPPFETTEKKKRSSTNQRGELGGWGGKKFGKKKRGGRERIFFPRFFEKREFSLPQGEKFFFLLPPPRPNFLLVVVEGGEERGRCEVIRILPLKKNVSMVEVQAKHAHATAAGFSLVGLVWSILAIVYGNQPLPACATTFAGITFDYPEWLQIFGYVGVSVNAFTLVTTILSWYWCEGEEGTCGKKCKDVWNRLLGTFVSLFAFFSLCWYIVGAIILFKTLHHEDCNNEAMWKFGLAYFIYFWSVIGLCCCCVACLACVGGLSGALSS